MCLLRVEILEEEEELTKTREYCGGVKSAKAASPFTTNSCGRKGGHRAVKGVGVRSQDRNSYMSGNNRREEFFHMSWDCSKEGSQSKSTAVLSSLWKNKSYLGVPLL